MGSISTTEKPNSHKNTMRQIPATARSKSSKKTKIKFFLFCEGEKTEPDYFRALEQTLTNVRIVARRIGVPKTTIEAAQAKQEELKQSKDTYEKNDQVWAVFDKDKHSCFDDSVRRGKDVKIKTAESNPCFELWLILHRQDYDKPETHTNLQKECEKIFPKYDRKKSKTLDFSKIIGSKGDAIKRATKQITARKKECAHSGIWGAPYTKIGELVKAILTADETE